MPEIKNKATIEDDKEIITSNEVEVDEKILKATIVKSTTFVGEWKSGDTIKWKFVITNPNKNATKANIKFSDTLDLQTAYIPSTFKVDNITKTPTTTTPAVTYTILTLAPLASTTIEFDVLCN